MYRQGRTRHLSQAETDARRQCDSGAFIALAVIGTLFLTYHLWSTEAFFAAQQAAFTEVAEQGGVVGASGARSGELAHLAAPEFSATVGDPDFGLNLNGGLKLSRHTEYCQWQELEHERCEKCTRQGSDGKDESYDCNCVVTYSYVKGWRSHRILSIGFDQVRACPRLLPRCLRPRSWLPACSPTHAHL